MDIKNYLARIGITQELKNNLDDLTHLQQNHVTQVPFENLDILKSIPLSFDPNYLYEKIAIRQRGGVCYELNGFFHVLLRELNFDVSMRAATVNLNGSWFKEGTHLTNIVLLNGEEYLVDVGFGGNTPSIPIPLTGEKIFAVNAYYRVKPYAEEQRTWVLEKKEDADWIMLYKFSEEEKVLDDFKSVCDFTQYSEQSTFNKTPVIMKVTDKGRITLHDHSLTIVEGLKKTKHTFGPEQTINIYKELFDLEI
ncbi:arylamine N-acetyltransferase family protein [Shimazuella kribbensis]|uniref:arylamine N-acetyltransferase family protein n=1 Tax=Shimazuella kribbensis TaxID=139808 RepID=UPI0004290AD8|nr:arylamine N-acetyltransferase [Shimazuella kribbensis]